MKIKLKWDRHDGKRTTWKARPTSKTRYRIVRTTPKTRWDGERWWYGVYVNGVMLDSVNRLADAKAEALKDFEHRQENNLA